MKTNSRLMLSVVITLMLLVSFTGVALAFDSGDKPVAPGEDTIVWTGQGGVDDFTEECPSTDNLPGGINPNSYLHWILTTDGGEADSATLFLGGTGSGSYSGSPTGGAFHFFTPYFDLEGLTASADIHILETGNGAWILTISHGCAGFENLDVSKTANTSFTREHFWSIDKSVDPTDLYLYIPGQGDDKPSSGTATWTVDVNYLGYEDSDWNVSGTITIENTGTLDAVITDVQDSLVAPDCGVTFPYTLPVGDTLTCTYSYDGYVEGTNVATVTTQVKPYPPAIADIVWGDPSTEINKTVSVFDSNEGFLGSVTAPDNATFTYSEDFNWADFGDSACGDHSYDNTAWITGDDDVILGDPVDATLNVHVQCHVFTTAYGMGTTPTCFIPTFSNWGWTNYLAGPTTQTWNLYAGAAGCDTSKGTLVGTVTVTYNVSGFVAVYFNVSAPYSLSETHVYAGYTKFQKVGKFFTVSPGQYTNVGPFSGPIYVIAHAKVGLPDPNFP